AGCTTKESLYEDNANRSFLIYIDESKEQDEKIMAYQRSLSAGKIDLSEQLKTVEQFQDMQRILKPVSVRNPYAEQLQIPKEVFKPRRTNAHYLAFIEAVTFYHQYQREPQYDQETGEEYIETTLEDIAEANRLMKDILLRKSDDLNGACRSYFESLKAWMKSEDNNTFTNASARQSLKVKASNQKRYMLALQEWGLVQKVKGDKKNGFAYEVTTFEDQQQRSQRINNVLDTNLEKLQKKGSSPRGSKVVHKSK
ncbi:MAG: hypothetical protein AAFO69_11925, partial [Bacteroidota bacterium]